MADVCRWCGCEETVTRKCTDESPHYAGLFCVDCDRWIKWLPKPKGRKERDMNRYERLAAEIIDVVEHEIREAHPEVEALASACEGNTLLHGEVYYNLEERLASQIKKAMTGDAHAVLHIDRGVMHSCEVFMEAEAASERQAEIFETMREQGAWDFEEGDEEFTLEMYNSGDRLLTIEDCKIMSDEEEV